MRLHWHDYKYYPYEKNLATRELKSLIQFSELIEVSDGVDLANVLDCSKADRLTYFKSLKNDKRSILTVQAKLERSAINGGNRQATRYSVHGLHEYKGKFNPQVARALINIFRITPGQLVLDPFCGSGTTLVECAHLGIDAIGTDINPLAVFLSNAKLLSLSGSVLRLRKVQSLILHKLTTKRKNSVLQLSEARVDYLLNWFDQDVFEEIENVRKIISDNGDDLAPIFLSVASNLLREYSQQDPNDLRIRRRKSPLPSISYTEAFIEVLPKVISRVIAARKVIGTNHTSCRACLCDVSELTRDKNLQKFDSAITSPPYAMALPYIDTQRLSLVWLDLLPPDQIAELESSLIGSRELRGKSKHDIPQAMAINEACLPDIEHSLCMRLAKSIDKTDGFRRQAVPSLLYRYFASMKTSFRSVSSLMKRGAPYALIVGHNHTTIGGVRYDIDTPLHLANLATSTGWNVEELIPLQTYSRYGYHVSNAVSAETLMILRKR